MIKKSIFDLIRHGSRTEAKLSSDFFMGSKTIDEVIEKLNEYKNSYENISFDHRPGRLPYTIIYGDKK